MDFASLNVTLPPEDLFAWSSRAAMVGWLVLIFGPRRWKQIVWLPQFVIPLGLSAVYSTVMLTSFYTVDGGFTSLSALRQLFESDAVLLGGWVHYLAFDLFIGAWIAQRSDEVGISRLIQPIFLVATFMFGPLGLLLFAITRSFFPLKETTS
ncbi:MAG: ABA4-like family protein [Pseudomonadota bacterium]